MSEVNSTTEVQIDEVAVAAETERLLKVAAERNGIPVDDLRVQYNQTAREQAVKNLEEESKRGTSFKSLYEAERQRRELAETQLGAVRDQRSKSATTGPNPHVLITRAKASVGEHIWNQKFTDSQKLAAVGIAPESVDLKEAQRVFGRGAKSQLGIDLSKASPERYRTLKLAALATGKYGA
jgi:hypothetical protein